MAAPTRTSAHRAAAPADRPSSSSLGRERVQVSDKRDAIMQAALSLFVERGFYGTTVPEIADRASVGAGTIYRYFDSKEALVNALYRQEKLRFGHEVLDDFPTAATTREQFRLLWTRMARYASQHESSFAFMELHHHARYLDAESRTVEARMLDLFVHVIANAQGRGELKAGSPRLLIGLVMGAFIGVVRNCVELEQPPSSADWQLAEQCIWEAIRT